MGSDDPSLAGRRRDVLKALCMLSCRERKDRNPDRVPGTCEWFVNHESFRQWQEQKSSTMLWVSATPGCGKSVLAKYLDDFEDQKSATVAVSSILQQLFEQKPILLSQDIVERFELYGKRLTESFGELWDILLTVSRNTNAGEIICMFDAFDECENTTQSELAKALRKFFGSRTGSGLKFLITSRPWGKIRRSFQPLYIPEVPAIHLTGEGEIETAKIAKEIDVYIRARVRNIQESFHLSPDEVQLLMDRLLGARNRTYLWVHLVLDMIETSIHIDEAGIKAATSVLPQSVEEAYEKILSKSYDVQESKRLLSIIVAATRPLTLAEMAVALTIRKEHASYRDLNLKSEERFREYLRDLCGLFVTVVSSKVYLLHQTAKEFLVMDDPGLVAKGAGGRLQWKWSLRLEECHRSLFEICAWHLLLKEFEEEPIKSFQPQDLHEYIQKHPFLDYSARNWAIHFRLSKINVDDAAKDSLLAICKDSQRRYTWFKTYWGSDHGKYPWIFTTLMVASYFGIEPVVRHLIARNDVALCSTDSSHKRSALSWASENGHEGVVKLMLSSCQPPERLRVNMGDRYGRTPLSYAAMSGNVAIAKMLLKAGARASLEDKLGMTPLSYAILNGNETVITLLERKEDKKSSAESTMQKMLLSAAGMGDGMLVMRLLRTKRVDVNGVDERGLTPLDRAIENTGEVDLETTGLISVAAQHGSKDVIERLLERGGRTPLSWAAIKGHVDIVQLLLDSKKVDIDPRDSEGRTPLSHASQWEHSDIMQLLLITEKVDINSRDSGGRTPLSRAASGYGREAAVKLLLETGKVDVDSKDSHGRTPLTWAAGYGNVECVRLLLDTGKADINSKDSEGRTPLSWAQTDRWWDREAVKRLLLDRGATK
ncbi:ankyrin repeat-containing domain protein [Podospora aff. communis PSN243]|uniref:Ankyrin repeat-containing domain protein n=1 Tax=Podospora aff. communis PSN243 TaxID=3040156 RepID=A0AAV9GHB7_9PEZI|nr:ankyrin repeat-containing domain protein [Podospora aff. communis PSN243]